MVGRTCGWGSTWAVRCFRGLVLVFSRTWLCTWPQDRRRSSAQFSAVCPDGLRVLSRQDLSRLGCAPARLCSSHGHRNREVCKAKVCADDLRVFFAGSSSQPSLCTWPQEVGSKTAKGVRYARLATSRDALAHTAWGPRTILPYSGRLAGHSRRGIGVCAL